VRKLASPDPDGTAVGETIVILNQCAKGRVTSPANHKWTHHTVQRTKRCVEGYRTYAHGAETTGAIPRWNITLRKMHWTGRTEGVYVQRCHRDRDEVRRPVSP
jgi:hypothetical protein